MNYYVHADHKNKKLRVHLGSCKYCREGKGMAQFAQLPDKRWHGPYPTSEAAQALAKTLNVKDRRTCVHCLNGRNF